MRAHFAYRSVARQKGATLVIALLVLVLIMMIGITAVSTSNTQYKLAGNLQFEDGAMNNAEAAVSTAEKWVAANYNNAGFVTYDATNSPHLYPIFSGTGFSAYDSTQSNPCTNNPRNPLCITWSDSNSLSVGSVAQRYQIQLMSTNNLLAGSSAVVGRQAMAVCNKVNTYLITGRGTSSRGASKLVQSYYSVLSCPAS